MPETPWADPVAFGPTAWRMKKRPALSKTPTNDEKLKQLMFDVLYAGASSSKRWEEEWPLMTEHEFDDAMNAASKLELGGQFSNGSHPRAE